MPFMTPISDVLPPVAALTPPLWPESREATCKCGAKFQQALAFGRWMPTICDPCGAAADTELRAAEAAEAQRRRRESAMQALQVPAQYTGATIESYELYGSEAHRRKQGRVLQLVRRYLAMWPDRQGSDWRDFPHISIWRGAPGTGKDHLAWAIARHVAVEQGERIVFCELSDAIRDLREAWSRRRGDGPSEAERLDRYRKADLLIVSEVSRHAFHGEATQHLYDVVAWREKWLRPTILTSNETADELAAIIGPALASRAAGWGGVWDFGEEDARVHLRRERRRLSAGGR